MASTKTSGTFNPDGVITCGCTINAEGSLSVTWCLLHGAAPEMLELLHQVEEDIAWLAGANPPNSKLGKAIKPVIERVCALLDRLEPARIAARTEVR